MMRKRLSTQALLRTRLLTAAMKEAPIPLRTQVLRLRLILPTQATQARHRLIQATPTVSLTAQVKNAEATVAADNAVHAVPTAYAI